MIKEWLWYIGCQELCNSTDPETECDWGCKLIFILCPVSHFLLASIVFIIWTTMKFRMVTCQSVSYKHVHLCIWTVLYTDSHVEVNGKVCTLPAIRARIPLWGLERAPPPKYSVSMVLDVVGFLFYFALGGGGSDYISQQWERILQVRTTVCHNPILS